LQTLIQFFANSLFIFLNNQNLYTMKKVIFSAFAVCSCVFAYAQPNVSQSTTPGGLAGPVMSGAAITLTLHNAIEILPARNTTYAATFSSVADYNGAAKPMGSDVWDVKSTRPGVVSFVLSNLTDPSAGGQTVSNDKMTMTVNTLPSVNGAGTLPTVNFPSGVNLGLATVDLSVHPTWAHQGGIYRGTLMVTATQL
jgi:hypothetical protein